MEVIDIIGTREIDFNYTGESYRDNKFWINLSNYTFDTDYVYEVKEGDIVKLTKNITNGVSIDVNLKRIIISILANELQAGNYIHTLKSVNDGVDVKLTGIGQLKLK